jgi:polysaccharide export outer membrane protein
LRNKNFPRSLNLFDKRGLTTVTNLNQVQIHRQFQRKPLILTTNFWNLLKEGIIQQDIILRDGDTVIVPTQDNIDIPQTCTIQCIYNTSLGLLANREINVAVVGEVYRTGSY